MSFKPRHIYQYAILVIAGILLLSSFSAYRNLRKNLDEDITIHADQLVPYFNVALAPLEPQSNLPVVTFIDELAGSALLKINLPKHVRTGILEIKLDPKQPYWQNYMYFRALQVYKGVVSSLNITSNKWVPIRPDNLTYQIPLYRDTTKEHILLQIKYEGSAPGVTIDSISIKPSSFLDFPIGAILVSIAVIAGTFLSGLLLASVIPQVNILPLPVTAFLLSLPVNLFALAVCKFTKTDLLFLPVVVLTTGGLIWIFRSRKQDFAEQLSCLYKRSIPDLNVWICLLAMICITMSYIYPSMLKNIHHGHVTQEHTFKAFTAHDAIFQYVNSKAILENDFAKYYGTRANPKLIYLAQDREILPGLNYAALTLFLQNVLGGKISGQYFPYAVYFLICHALMISMLFAWLKDLDLRLAYISIFFIATTPCFWTLAMVGWFKLTGAAFILAGIYVIKEQPRFLSRWIVAGILFGLAKNFHGGNVLVLPIFTIWLLYVVKSKYPSVSLMRLGVSFFSLTCVACALIFPWNWFVTHIWGVSSHMMFSSFFLGGHYVQDSLAQSIVNFFHSVPWEEQLDVRLNRLSNIFDFDWFTNTLAQYQVMFGGIVLGSLKFSASYLFPAIAPYGLLAVILALVTKRLAPEKRNEALMVDPWFSQFGWICFANIIFLAFISYGSEDGYPAITWELPTLTIIGILCHFVIWSCNKSRNNATFWLGLGCFQAGLLVAFG